MRPDVSCYRATVATRRGYCCCRWICGCLDELRARLQGLRSRLLYRSWLLTTDMRGDLLL